LATLATALSVDGDLDTYYSFVTLRIGVSMRMSKLTLSADKELIRQAKKLAAENGTSVSAMFSRMLRAMDRTSALEEPPAPLTRKATGLIRLPSADEDERLLEDALAAKYGRRK
jgi:hypothetical protein